MRCEEFLRLLDEDAVGSSEEARAHAEGCPTCARAIERAAAVHRELRAMGTEPMPPFLHTRIMAGVRSAAPAPRPAIWALRQAWAGPLLVLALLAALGGWGLWRALSPGGAGEIMPVVLAPQAAPAAPENAFAGGTGKLKGGPPAPAPELAERQTTTVHADKLEGTLQLHEQAGRAPARRLAAAPPPAPPARRALKQNEAAQEPAVAAAGAQAFAPEPAEPPGAVAPVESLAARDAVVGGVTEARSASPGQEARAGAPFARAAARPALKAEAARVQAEVASVPCRLVAETGTTRVGVQIPERIAPPPGATWLVAAGEDGAVTLDEAAPASAEIRRELTLLLQQLHLVPGRYRLTRAPE